MTSSYNGTGHDIERTKQSKRVFDNVTNTSSNTEWPAVLT